MEEILAVWVMVYLLLLCSPEISLNELDSHFQVKNYFLIKKNWQEIYLRQFFLNEIGDCNFYYSYLHVRFIALCNAAFEKVLIFEIFNPAFKCADDLTGLIGAGNIEFGLRAVFAFHFAETPYGVHVLAVFTAFAVQLLVTEHDGGPSAFGQHFFVQFLNNYLTVFFIMYSQIFDCFAHDLSLRG